MRVGICRAAYLKRNNKKQQTKIKKSSIVVAAAAAPSISFIHSVEKTEIIESVQGLYSARERVTPSGVPRYYKF